MRITFKAVNRHLQNTIHERYSDLTDLQEKLATGKRLQRPSDDPVDIANDLKLRSKLVEISQYKDNINDGLSFMAVTDTAMVSMNNLLQRSRELAIQAGNDTLTQNEREFIKKEIEQLTRQVISLVNTNYKGDYIFGGTQTKISPYPLDSSISNTPESYTDLEMTYYDGSGGVGTPAQLYDAFNDRAVQRIIPGTFSISVAGVNYVEGTDYTIDYLNGTITPLNPALAIDVSDGGLFTTGPNGYYNYTGANKVEINFDYVNQATDIYGEAVSNRGNILREIETGIKMAINIPGEELLTDTQSGLNALDVMIRFSDYLSTGNSARINESIGEIDAVFENILSAQSKNGARINRFETTLERTEIQFTETTRLQSELEDADFATTLSEFSLLENVYNAALQTGARIIQPSLVDFL